MDRLELTLHVARRIWEQRKFFLRQTYDVELEPWGDGLIPKANGILQEALAAIEGYEAAMNQARQPIALVEPPQGLMAVSQDRT